MTAPAMFFVGALCEAHCRVTHASPSKRGSHSTQDDSRVWKRSIRCSGEGEHGVRPYKRYVGANLSCNARRCVTFALHLQTSRPSRSQLHLLLDTNNATGSKKQKRNQHRKDQRITVRPEAPFARQALNEHLERPECKSTDDRTGN
jgi:hypothetical protein